MAKGWEISKFSTFYRALMKAKSTLANFGHGRSQVSNARQSGHQICIVSLLRGRWFGTQQYHRDSFIAFLKHLLELGRERRIAILSK